MSERVGIVGSREFKGPQMVRDYVAALPPGTVVVSGGARGVDAWAESAARARKLVVVVHRARWAEHGRYAGIKRNGDIVRDADRIAAFWDGSSRGTAHTIELARKLGKPVEVITWHS